MKNILFAAGFSLLVAPVALAGPEEDAASIAEATITHEILDGVVVALGPVMAGSIQNDLRSKGITVSNPDALVEIVVDEFADMFVEGMRKDSVPVYLNLFSPDELADIAAFYQSDAGKALVAKTPALMQAGAQMGQKLGMEAGQALGPRIAKRARDEGLVFTDSAEENEKLLEALE